MSVYSPPPAVHSIAMRAGYFPWMLVESWLQRAARAHPDAIALPAHRAFAETLHGCLLLAAPAVPIDLRLKPAERRLRTEGCVAVIGEPLDGLIDTGAPIAGTHDLHATAIV